MSDFIDNWNATLEEMEDINDITEEEAIKLIQATPGLSTDQTLSTGQSVVMAYRSPEKSKPKNSVCIWKIRGNVSVSVKFEEKPLIGLRRFTATIMVEGRPFRAPTHGLKLLLIRNLNGLNTQACPQPLFYQLDMSTGTLHLRSCFYSFGESWQEGSTAIVKRMVVETVRRHVFFIAQTVNMQTSLGFTGDQLLTPFNQKKGAMVQNLQRYVRICNTNPTLFYNNSQDCRLTYLPHASKEQKQALHSNRLNQLARNFQTFTLSPDTQPKSQCLVIDAFNNANASSQSLSKMLEHIPVRSFLASERIQIFHDIDFMRQERDQWLEFKRTAHSKFLIAQAPFVYNSPASDASMLPRNSSDRYRRPRRAFNTVQIRHLVAKVDLNDSQRQTCNHTPELSALGVQKKIIQHPPNRSQRQKLVFEKFRDKSCQNIIRAFKSDSAKFRNWLFMDFAYQKTVDEFLREHWVIALPTKIRIAIQMLRAVRFVHDCRVVHLNLARNKFLVNKGLVIQLIDFGEAYHPNMKLPDLRTSTCQNHPFTSPEQYSPQPTYTPQMDVYALGGLLHWLIFDQVLFEQTSQQCLKQLYSKKRYKGKLHILPQSCAVQGPEWLMVMLRRVFLLCLDIDPSRRPTVQWLIIILSSILQFFY